MNEARFRETEQRLWKSFGVSPTERRVRLSHTGVNVRVQELGEGPPVIFVHGASNAGASWVQLAMRLEGFRCVMLDRPGCGLSDPLVAGLSDIDQIETYADNMVPDVIEALGLDRAHVVSTSYGGYFALRGAAAHPERVDRMVEMSWTIGAPMTKVPLAMRVGGVPGIGWLMARIPPTDGSVKMILRQVGLRRALESGQFNQVMIDWFRSLQRDTPTMRNDISASPKLITPIRGLNERVLLSADLLARVQAPIKFLWGVEDPNGGEDVARAFVDLIPKGELEMMAEAGHAPWVDDPDHAAAVTSAFLNG